MNKNFLKLLISTDKFNHADYIYGDEEPEWNESDFEDYDREINLKPVRSVIDECLNTKGITKKQADARIGLALHDSLKLTRKEAINPNLWCYLSCVFAPDYVKKRWGNNWDVNNSVTVTARARYLGGSLNGGPRDTNTFHYLWWAVELTKDFDYDGKYLELFVYNWNYHTTLFRPTYSNVPTILKAVLEAVYIDWEDWPGWKKGKPMPDVIGKKAAYRRKLYSQLNIAGSTIVFESLTYDEAKDLVNTIKSKIN